MRKKKSADGVVVAAKPVGPVEASGPCSICGSRLTMHGHCAGCGMSERAIKRLKAVTQSQARCPKCDGVLRGNAFNDSGACDNCGGISSMTPVADMPALSDIERQIRADRGPRKTGARK